MNKELFTKACTRIVSIEKTYQQIGTLKEKTLHAILKYYFEEDASKHEIKINGFYADIFNDNQIIEIQTKQFDKLRKKLDFFLINYPVTIVYPIANKKYISYINPNTGEISKQRLSPKRANIYEVFKELYKIKFYLSNPNLKFCFLLIDMEEYRLLNGWNDNKKRGAGRANQIPLSLEGEVYLNNTNDYKKLIPIELLDEFTSKDYAKYAKINLHVAQIALNVLTHINVVERIGKLGNNIIYKRS